VFDVAIVFAKVFDVSILGLSSAGREGFLHTFGIGVSNTTKLSVCGIRFSLEAAVASLNLLREARMSLDGERMASLADSGGNWGGSRPLDLLDPVSSSPVEDWAVMQVDWSGTVKRLFFLLPTRSLNSLRSRSHLLFWFPSISKCHKTEMMPLSWESIELSKCLGPPPHYHPGI